MRIVTDFVTPKETFTYDKKHNLSAITDSSSIAVARNEYDDSGRLIATIDANGNRTQYDHDVVGRTELIIDRLGNTTTYVYDENARRIKVILADGAESTSEYDDYGMLITTTDYNGVITTYSYDGEDRIIKETNGDETTSYTYDTLGRLTDVATKDSHITYSYNQYGELSAKSYENGQVISYSYDKYGRTDEIKVSQKDKTLSSTKYEYDSMNRLTRVVGHDGIAVVYTYDVNGNRETATYANGVVLTYTYDECNRLTLQKVVDKSGKAIAQYQYTLKDGGERTKVTEEGPEGTIETSYEYDKAGRLTKEIIQKGDEKTTYKYEYDSVGNRTEKSENSNITKYTYNSRNQLVEEQTENGTIYYSYDANGNLLNQSGAGKSVTYKYDVYNRLIQYAEGEKKESYTYDAEGVRRSKENDEDTVYFISDTSSSLSYTLVETDAKGDVIVSYNRADILIGQSRGESVSYYLFDGHGDVRGLLDKEGNVTDTYRYNAYGELIESAGETENHYLYTGEYYDGTSNLYYLRARYMNPSTGTFISMDTYEGSIYDPDTLHKYLYANGNPVKYSDPTGNFFSAVGVLMGTTINTINNNCYTLHTIGMLSGFGNAVVTQILGGSDKEVAEAFFQGYFTGFAIGTIMYVVAAYEILTIAQIGLFFASVDTVMSLVMTIGSIISGDKKQTLVSAVLLILSVVSLYNAYNLCGSIKITGDKGSATVRVESGSGSLNEEIFTRYMPDGRQVTDVTNLPGSTGIKTSRRLTTEEMTFLTQEYGVEFAQVYKYGNGINGGGGQYYLYSGTVSSVKVPIGNDIMLINHTHPAGTAYPSSADKALLGKYQQFGSPQISSEIIPIGKGNIRFNINGLIGD